jgi:N6-adenosine-specific RNA methylase IME4
MSMDEIKSIPMDIRLLILGCHVYCWTTNKYLRDTFNILKSWNVNYHLTLVWTKPNGMTPNALLTSLLLNFVLLGFYGKPMQKFLKCGKLNWINCLMLKNQHSTKPKEFFDLVDEMSPGPKLEMFARQQRDNWTVFGNEI